MTLFDDILSQFPSDVQATVRMIWEALGPNEKASFQSLLLGFPSDSNLVRTLVKLSTAQIRQAFGTKHRVAIVGPTNVGKSTLYNCSFSARSRRFFHNISRWCFYRSVQSLYNLL